MTDSSENSKNLSVLPYEILCRKIKPGDVVAFSSRDLPSVIVKAATQSQYVHVAIVLSVYPTEALEDPVLIAESHIDNSLPSVGLGEGTVGVQFQWLSDRLNATPGKAWWAPLKPPLSDEATHTMQAWLSKLESQKTPYDFFQAIGAGVNALGQIDIKNKRDFSAFFCSELVTRALQLGGVLDAAVNPSEQTPADVMQLSCLQSPVLIKVDD